MLKANIKGNVTLDYAGSEALNTICSNLSFSGRNIKKIVITSCEPNDGKSFVAFQIALNMARRGKKVVLMDADLRLSVMNAHYDIQLEGKGTGLAHFLSGQCPFEEAMYKTNVPNVFFIPIGTDVQAPLSLIATPDFDHLVQSLGETFDLVIIDAPPVGLVIDAAEIAKSCDGSVLVMEYGKTHRRALQEAKQQMERTATPILGCVLNKVTMDRLSTKKYYSYGGKYGYSKYGRYGKYGYSRGYYRRDKGDKKKSESPSKPLRPAGGGNNAQKGAHVNKRTILKAAVILAAALILLAAGILFLQSQENAEYAEKRGSMSEGFGQLKTIEWQGRTYREKPAVTTLLIAGTDRFGDPDATGSKAYRKGSPADFLMLLAIDHTSKQIHQLQIDRDTMTDVMVLGVFGNEVGTRVMQICLSHYYGDTPEANAKYTIRAVQNLLDGLEIDGYYMIDYSAVPVLNDALGGVPIHLDFDMTSVNPAWTKGKDIVLHGQEAETFVRSRMTIGSGTNEERMVRQGEFMRQAIKKMTQRAKDDLEFGESLLKSLESIATTNMTTRRLAEEISGIHHYEVLDIDHPAGEYKIGEDGYVEFHMKENAAVEWVLEHLYTPLET